MLYKGEFYNIKGEVIEVLISINNGVSGVVEIGDGESGIDFADDPVDIQSEVNDTFDTLLRSSATIRLETDRYIPDFFTVSPEKAVVNIWREGVCLFAGFLLPMSYSQDFNSVSDGLELSCVDLLSALSYANYADVTTRNYDVLKSAAELKSFGSIIKDVLRGLATKINLKGASGLKVLYDGCVKADEIDTATVFDRLAVSEALFFGDDDGSVWKKDEVVGEILRFLDLHIIQEGLEFRIFSWRTVMAGGTTQWENIFGEGAESTTAKTVEISLKNVTDTDTNISIGETFNSFELSCELKEIDNVIDSPLDSDTLTSPYSNIQKYATELSVDVSNGGGNTELNSFCQLVWDKPDSVKSDKAKMVVWYLQPKTNPYWRFPGGEYPDIVEHFGSEGKNMHELPNWLCANQGGAIIAVGSENVKLGGKDDSPTSSVSMSEALFISVNGNGEDSEEKAYPTDAVLLGSTPRAEYVGSSSGGAFSPVDDFTTNYIVISGKIALNPLLRQSGDVAELYDCKISPGILTMITRVPEDRWYVTKFHASENPSLTSPWVKEQKNGLIPNSSDTPKEYQFNYSAIGDSSDHISKVSALACMLIIGDKCVVESGTSGKPSDFTWRTYKKREQCASDDEYYQQCFTIGFNPKIGDKLIGTEFDIQNNITLGMGLNTEGTAIPIRRADKVSGQVKFLILGPVNTVWGNVTRRHRTWFRREKWSSSEVPLMSHVSTIQVTDFEVKIHSDNGLANNASGRDIIYMSDTDESFVNPKDDISFKINSALTAEEAKKLNVAVPISLSHPVFADTGDTLTQIFDTHRRVTAKPEQLYVDSYYKEYHSPRIILSQKLEDNSDIIGLFNTYVHPALEKEFFIQGLSRNLRYAEAQLQLKEKWI